MPQYLFISVNVSIFNICKNMIITVLIYQVRKTINERLSKYNRFSKLNYSDNPLEFYSKLQLDRKTVNDLKRMCLNISAVLGQLDPGK